MLIIWVTNVVAGQSNGKGSLATVTQVVSDSQKSKGEISEVIIEMN